MHHRSHYWGVCIPGGLPPGRGLCIRGGLPPGDLHPVGRSASGGSASIRVGWADLPLDTLGYGQQVHPHGMHSCFIRILGEKINSFAFFEYCPMHLNKMSILPILCIMGKLEWIQPIALSGCWWLPSGSHLDCLVLKNNNLTVQRESVSKQFHSRVYHFQTFLIISSIASSNHIPKWRLQFLLFAEDNISHKPDFYSANGILSSLCNFLWGYTVSFYLNGRTLSRHKVKFVS